MAPCYPSPFMKAISYSLISKNHFYAKPKSQLHMGLSVHHPDLLSSLFLYIMFNIWYDIDLLTFLCSKFPGYFSYLHFICSSACSCLNTYFDIFYVCIYVHVYVGVCVCTYFFISKSGIGLSIYSH